MTTLIAANSTLIQMQFLYSHLLSQDANIIAMIDASEAGNPALSACVVNVEVCAQSSQSINLTDEFTRTAIGRMIKTILKAICTHSVSNSFAGFFICLLTPMCME